MKTTLKGYTIINDLKIKDLQSKISKLEKAIDQNEKDAK